MAKKEMTITELKDKLGVLQEERNGIFEKLKTESRKANADEEKRLGEIASEVAETEYEIKLAEARTSRKDKTKAEGESFGTRHPLPSDREYG